MASEEKSRNPSMQKRFAGLDVQGRKALLNDLVCQNTVPSLAEAQKLSAQYNIKPMQVLCDGALRGAVKLLLDTYRTAQVELKAQCIKKIPKLLALGADPKLMINTPTGPMSAHALLYQAGLDETANLFIPVISTGNPAHRGLHAEQASQARVAAQSNQDSLDQGANSSNTTTRDPGETGL